jgi:hypothetical protein
MTFNSMLSLCQPVAQVLQNTTNTLLELGTQFADHVQLPDLDNSGAISALATVTLALVGIYYIAPRVERYFIGRFFDPLPRTPQIPGGALQAAALPTSPSSQGASSLGNRPIDGGSSSQSIFPYQFPEEILTRIVGYLDIRGAGSIASVCQLFSRLQGDNSVWYKILPRVRSFQVDFGLPAKERARRFLADIPLGDKTTYTVCTLNPYSKTITTPYPSSEVFQLALSRPEVPNRSFVVFTEEGNRQIPCAVIKNAQGVVRCVYDTRVVDGEDLAVMLDLRACEGTSLQYQEFKEVLTEEARVKKVSRVGEPFLTFQQQRALRWLKGTQDGND